MTSSSLIVENPNQAECLLTPEEMGSLRSTYRWFLAGLTVSAGLAVVAGTLITWYLARGTGVSVAVAGLSVAFAALTAVALWCGSRARMVGRDIRTGQVEVRWGRVTRMWRHLRVVEVEGVPFPLQMTPVPALREGERVRLRFAPRSRLTLAVHTLREVVAAERLAGRPVCAGVLAELGEQP
jgi:hypothetical protein